MGALVVIRLLLARAGRLHFPMVMSCILILGGTPGAQAYKLVPMVQEFDPTGRGSNRAFHVENDSDKPVAVQVSILSRRITPEGKEETTPADKDFTVYPSQILLKPKQTQTVRVKWMGTPNLTNELAYRILAEELPVNLNKEVQMGARVNLQVRYLGSIYVVPRGAKPNVVLESVTAVSDADPEQIAVVFTNRGTAHSLLRDLRMTFKSGGKTVELGPEALQGVAGENLLAGGSRRFLLPRPEGLPPGAIEATFDYQRK